ncbi:hypothetical protein BDF20DRAFT_811823, partial [Mycotypha africana]|uniref:uncharacterized protein n=1 Tax=Mycotypha africana TaxID=64632 RepID=UPI0023007B82
ELQHVNRWFSYLTEAERTATVVTLLQHSSPLQITFFTHLLQEMKKSKAETVNRSECLFFCPPP